MMESDMVAGAMKKKLWRECEPLKISNSLTYPALCAAAV
jgi:hypothetical protein